MIARFIASLLRFPVCDSCGAVEWSSAERAYALGWRLGSHLGAARFVRWYRWPILCFLAGLGGFVLFGVGVGADNPVAQAVGAGAAIFSVIPGVGTAVAASDRLRPVLDRYYRRRRRADEREKARLRAMPLRGWTR